MNTPKYPHKILLGLQEGLCNLSCPKCYTHGENAPTQTDRSKGVMPYDQFCKIIDEVAPYRPRIAPQTWDEPLILKDIAKYLKYIKENNLEITMDTNGLLLTTELMQFFIDIQLDSIFISLDSITAETYLKTRGKDKYHFLENIIQEFILLRGSKSYPRIGVSFVTEDSNKHEVNDFIEHWSSIVDVVRVNQEFTDSRQLANSPVGKRKPCWSLYDSLMIHWNGDSALCCVDTHYQVEIGNVFDSTVSEIWHGDQFKLMRKHHESDEFNKISICEQCELWTNDIPISRETEELVIKETLTHQYYNRKDRLTNLVHNTRFFHE